MEHLNWYPGHMKKTRELILENLKRVDVVLEVIDARIPVSSRNPVIDELVRHKQRVVVLNKSDLADAGENAKWVEALASPDTPAFAINAAAGTGVPRLMKRLLAIQEEKNRDRPRKKPVRLMVAGVPNVGKSSLINRLIGKKGARTGDRPGVTRGKQWLNLEGGIQLLDTPGILWPKFEDPAVGLRLAFCGAIKDEIMDAETLALELIRFLREEYPASLAARYKLDAPETIRDSAPDRLDEPETVRDSAPDRLDEPETIRDSTLDTMEAIARKRGFLLSGKRVDYERTAKTVLDEFRSGLIGKITIERADDMA